MNSLVSNQEEVAAKPESSAAPPLPIRPTGLAGAMLVLSISVLLLVPSCWQHHIQAGDLSSHVYNAWLAGEVRNGSAPGLALAHPWTNVLGDWLLEALLRRAGEVAAERIVAGLAVLVFFWGAFCFISRVAEKPAWMLCPVLSVLAYGLVFHFGFLNFYLSTGLSLWIMALLWRPSWPRAFLAVPLCVLALLAHSMPVAWAASMLGYSYAARRLAPKRRLLLLAAAAAGLMGLRLALTSLFPHREWSLATIMADGLLGLTGLEQVWVFGARYLIVAAGLLAICGWLFLQRAQRGGMLSDPVVHLWLLQAAAFFVLPTAIQIPPYQAPLTYIPQRLSLFIALFLCALAGGALYSRAVMTLSLLVAGVYFAFLYLDSRIYNQVEDQVAALVSALPPGLRVVAEISAPDTRLEPLLHVADRACIGRCYSFANYEPPSGQFRIRVLAPSPMVASSMKVVHEIQTGSHVVAPDEAPIYSLCLAENAAPPFAFRRLEAGERTCRFPLLARESRVEKNDATNRP